MGEIVASMELENTADRSIVSEGLRDESTVRRTTVKGVVDTGAVMLVRMAKGHARGRWLWARRPRSPTEHPTDEPP